MAKKTSTPRKTAAKPKQSTKPRAARAAKPKSGARRATSKAKPAARSTKKKPSAANRRKEATSECVANLAAGARQIGVGLRQGAALADPRKLIRGTSQKIRQIEFNRATDFCKKEWHELTTLAGKLREMAHHPEQPPRRHASRTRKQPTHR